MKSGENLFVYGTLRRGAPMDITRRFDGAEFVREDRVTGFLYKVGYFPGAQLQGDSFDPNLNAITGDVFAITNDTITRALDCYEGYPELFTRRQVTTESGILVWVYEYPREMPLSALIPMGDWLAAQNIRIEQEIGG